MRTLLLIATVLALATGIRAREWHDDSTVWGAAVQVTPLRPRVWVNYGRAQQINGNDQIALDAYHRAIGLSFDDRRLAAGNIYSRLAAETDSATVFLHQGNVQAAWNEIDTVLRDTQWPMFPYAVFHRGVMEAITNQCAKADRDWRWATRADGTLARPQMPANCRAQGFQ